MKFPRFHKRTRFPKNVFEKFPTMERNLGWLALADAALSRLLFFSRPLFSRGVASRRNCGFATGRRVVPAPLLAVK